MTQRRILQSKAQEHAPRALVLHVTPMDDNRVSACDGTATIVLVCRTVSPSGARLLDLQTDTRIQAPFQLRRTLVGLRLKPT